MWCVPVHKVMVICSGVQSAPASASSFPGSRDIRPARLEAGGCEVTKVHFEPSEGDSAESEDASLPRMLFTTLSIIVPHRAYRRVASPSLGRDRAQDASLYPARTLRRSCGLRLACPGHEHTMESTDSGLYFLHKYTRRSWPCLTCVRQVFARREYVAMGIVQNASEREKKPTTRTRIYH
ncbi:hypothetical protein OH77DRAFT_1004305 [Trametes cingulata]|nr:hypothetical protein OH77DRAFT_1004305 [Trametes cingulata]